MVFLYSLSAIILNIRPRLSIYTLLLFSLSVVACDNALPSPDHTPTSAQGTEPIPATFTPRPTPSLSPTPVIPIALLLAPQGVDPAQVEAAGQALSNLSAQEGIRWQMRPTLTAADLTPEVRLVVAFPPAIGLVELARGAPQIQFVAVGVQGLPTIPNLSQIGSEGPHPEQAGFLAGIIAAILTDEWRVGVVSLSDTPEGVAARQGFLNGVVFFCGLCRQIYPPYYQYPLYVEFPASASQAEKLSAAAVLKDRYVKTVYLFPGSADAVLVKALEEAGILIIGGASPGESLPATWAATIQTNPAASLQALLPDLLDGKGGVTLAMPLEIADINPGLFSPGRQALAQKYLDDILAGVIDTDLNP